MQQDAPVKMEVNEAKSAARFIFNPFREAIARRTD
jgi:hypothetical protein